jgi:hypothetical protein
MELNVVSGGIDMLLLGVFFPFVYANTFPSLSIISDKFPLPVHSVYKQSFTIMTFAESEYDRYAPNKWVACALYPYNSMTSMRVR